MVITILEAQVPADKAAMLEAAYRGATIDVPPEIVETFLVRDTGQASVFRIVTVWSSREALDRMRASAVTPKGVQIFGAVGASPKLSILDVLVRTSAGIGPSDPRPSSSS